MRLRRDVDPLGVVEHRRLERQLGVRADLAERVLRLRGQPLVANLEVARADAPAERARRLDLGPPLAREAGRRRRVRPRPRHDALRHGEERERGVTPVPDQVDVARVRKQPLEHAQVLHVHRRLVAPARLALPLGVGEVHLRDRLADGHPGPQPGAHVARRRPPTRAASAAARGRRRTRRGRPDRGGGRRSAAGSTTRRESRAASARRA